MSATIAYRRRDGNASDAIAAILNPDEGYREKLMKRGVVPKNYELANRLQLKKQQKEMREKRREAEAAQPSEFKLSKFKAVQPRVYGDKQVSQPPIKREFLRRTSSLPALQNKHDCDSIVPSPLLNPVSARASNGSNPIAKRGERSRRQTIKPPIPSRQELDEVNKKLSELHHKEQVDYVNNNAWEVIKRSPSKPVDDINTPLVHNHFGRIPTYLLHRKEEWAREEEERRRNLSDPDCPRGMMPMEEAERIRTLGVLQQSLVEARLKLIGLPLRIETLSQVRRKNELEAKLQEIEDAIAVFSKPKVYVPKPVEDVKKEFKLSGQSGRSNRTSAVAA